MEGVRSGFRELLSQPKLPAPLLAAASDLKKQMSGVYRTMRDNVQRHATGRVHPGEGGLEEACTALLERLRARVVAEGGGITDKQWRFVLTHGGEAAAAAAAPPAATDSQEQRPPTPPTPLPERQSSRAKRTPKARAAPAPADADGGDAAEEAEAARPEPEQGGPGASAAGAGDGEEEPSEGRRSAKRSKQRPLRPLTAASIPAGAAAPVGGAEEGAEGGAGDGEDVGEAGGRGEWKSTPDWLKRNMLVEVEWGSDWWQAKAIKCVKGKVPRALHPPRSESLPSLLSRSSLRIRPAALRVLFYCGPQLSHITIRTCARVQARIGCRPRPARAPAAAAAVSAAGFGERGGEGGYGGRY